LAEEEYVKAKELEEEWKNTVQETNEEARQMRKEAIRSRNINFDSAARHKPLSIRKDNMKKAAAWPRAMKQQSKADTPLSKANKVIRK
jgi:hypothetical protein